VIYVSTRTPQLRAGFPEAILQGLAPDGGLFQPAEHPDLRKPFLKLDDNTPFDRMAAEVLEPFLCDWFDGETIRTICRRAFPFSPALVRLTDEIMLLELFHGPSCAFKDFGASFLASAMEVVLAERDDHAVILTATSGDTGSAVARAFHNRPNIDVVILYPSGRVSPLQEKQLTTVGGNVTALEVAGSFDDCQRMVKEAFVDPELRSAVTLSSANSINLGRLLPQALYYVFAFSRLRAHMVSEFYYCVPSGNFGNLTAGVLAWKWGLPVDGFLAATNINDVVPEYLLSGVYSPRASVRTLANAMDVGAPSNFERLLAIFDNSHPAMASMITGVTATDAQIMETMRDVYAEHGVLLDPHTAAGVHGAQTFLAGEGAGDATIVTLATAHPAKFGEVVREACGVDPELPPQLAAVVDREKAAVPIAAEGAALKRFVLENYGG
jgi:threonine synthase